MSDQAPTPVALGAEPASGPPPVQAQPRSNRAIIVLSIIVGVETVLLLCVLAGGAVFLGTGALLFEPFFGDDAWIRADDIAMEVGYLIQDGDLESYLALYDRDDPHVDFEAIEVSFLNVADQPDEDVMEYMSQAMPAEYVDKETGETIFRVSVSGMTYEGDLRGGRLTLWVLDEDGAMRLTGRKDRDLEFVGSFW